MFLFVFEVVPINVVVEMIHMSLMDLLTGCSWSINVMLGFNALNIYKGKLFKLDKL